MNLRTLLVALVFCIAPASAEEPADGAKVYKQIVPSVVWIHTKAGTGSGTLIDKQRRLVLTNYHVVQQNPTAKIYFPVFRDGQPIAEKTYYTERSNRLAISGKVLSVDKSADLAIIRLESIPDGVLAVKVAEKSPGPGDSVHSIGNAGKSGALFGYVKGTVRQVYNKEWKAELSPRNIANFKAKVVETDSPTNPGDSGGPLLNNTGELVGVTQGGAINANSVSLFIDVSDIRRVLTRNEVKEPKEPVVIAEVPKRDKPLSVSDGGKIFTKEAATQADATIATLFKQDVDVMVVTYPVAPTKNLDELKRASSTSRMDFFRTLTRERMKRDSVSGVGIIICDDPKTLYVEMSLDAAKKFPEGFGLKLRDTLLKSLKDKKPDEGLNAVLKLIEEQTGKKQ